MTVVLQGWWQTLVCARCLKRGVSVHHTMPREELFVAARKAGWTREQDRDLCVKCDHAEARTTVATQQEELQRLRAEVDTLRKSRDAARSVVLRMAKPCNTKGCTCRSTQFSLWAGGMSTELTTHHCDAHAERGRSYDAPWAAAVREITKEEEVKG